MNIRSLAACLALAVGPFAVPAAAQDGCQVTQRSCSQINETCERNCQNGNNPSACVARICSVRLTACKADGLWKPPGGAACWRTNNRS